MKKATGCKVKEVDVHVIDKVLEGTRGRYFYLYSLKCPDLSATSSANPSTLLSIQSEAKAQSTPISQGGTTEIHFVTHAYGKALCLSVGEEASDSNFCETQRWSSST